VGDDVDDVFADVRAGGPEHERLLVLAPSTTGWSTSIVSDCGTKCTVSPSTRATSSAPASFQPAGSFNDAVTRIASGFSPSGDSTTVFQLITAHFALADAVAPNAPPPVGTT